MKYFTFLILFITQITFAQSIVKVGGSMSTMGSENFKGSILLDTLPKKNLFGIGPYGKMQGEITVIDGKPLVSEVQADGTATVSKNWKAEAPFFVYANVARWKSYLLITQIENINDLQRPIEELATQNGYNLSAPFPFRVSGTFTELITHVVTPRSADVTGYKPGRNQENYSLSKEKGELLGFYSQQHQGIYTQKDSYIHVHFINNKRTFMGHVDKIAVAKSNLIVMFPSK